MFHHIRRKEFFKVILGTMCEYSDNDNDVMVEIDKRVFIGGREVDFLDCGDVKN